jgi:hypothetical protein
MVREKQRKREDRDIEVRWGRETGMEGGREK